MSGAVRVPVVGARAVFWMLVRIVRISAPLRAPRLVARVGVGAPRLLFYDGIYAKVTIRSQISEKLGFGAPADDAGWRIVCAVSIVI